MESVAMFWNLLGQYIILENSLQNIVISTTILLGAFVLRRFLSIQLNKFIYRFVKSISSDIPVKEFVDLLHRPIAFFISLLLLYFAFIFIEYPSAWHLSSSRRFGMKMLIEKSYQLLLFISVIWTVFRIIDFFALVLKKKALETESKVQEQLVPFMRQLTKLIIGLVFFFVILAIVFKVNVGAVIAGLGIGGLAVALAGKETLENLLASFAIFVDRPFVTGDLIKAAGYTGSVETVGFRTTRIRTIDKSLLTIPNKQLVDQPLENLSSRIYHRAKFNISLYSQTPNETIKIIIKKIEEAITSHSKTNENYNVFLDDISGHTLDISVIYQVNAAEYEDFCKVKEELNYTIKEIVDVFGEELEYPASIVYLRAAKENTSNLSITSTLPTSQIH